MNELISIIIPTKNRIHYLERLLTFINEREEFSIFILDSSQKQKVKDSSKTLFKKKNIKIFDYSKDISVNEKISKVCNFLNTKYAVLCADDDFLIPESVKMAAEFLDNNSDYASAHGNYYVHPNYEQVNLNGKFYLNKIYHGENISSQNSFERLKQYLQHKTTYYPYYALHRTEDFKKIWEDNYKYTTFNRGYSEIIPCSLSLLIGNQKILPIFWMSKESNNIDVFEDINILNKYYSEKNFNLYFESLINFSKKIKLENRILVKNFYTIKELMDKKKFFTHPKVKKKLYGGIRKFKILQDLLNKIRIRNRISEIFFKGCNLRLIKKNFSDYIKIKNLVLKYKLDFESMNSDRNEVRYV